MTELAIIGAGVIGCAVALEVARRGGSAIVIDRNGDVGHGTTAASSGIVRRFYSTETMSAMAEEGARTWADWGAHLGAGPDEHLAVFHRPGMLFIPQVIDERIEGIVAQVRALGVEVDLLDAQEVGKRFPYLVTRSQLPVREPGDSDFFDDSGHEIAGGVFERDSGYVVSPHIATMNLRDAGLREGVRFELGRGVTAIGPGAGGAGFRLELEGGGALQVDAVLNAAGPHSGRINALAGVNLPIETRPLRREVCTVENPVLVEGGPEAPVVVGDLDSGVYFRAESGGRDLLVGSLDPECDTLEWVDDPDENSESCTPEVHERQVLRMMKRFPNVRYGDRRGLASLYDVTVLDWNPVLDRTELPGFYVAIGTSGSSFKTAPVIGAVMAELIDACEGGRNHDEEPVKVKLPRTGFELDVSFFSRLRGAHATSGTVLG